MNVSIIIINYNTATDTIACLQSLAKMVTKHDISIIVVDNNSVNKDENSKFQSFNKKFKFKLIELNSNIGFSGGNNVGIRHAIKHDADAVILLNNDTTVDPYFIDRLVDRSIAAHHMAIIGSKIYFAPGYEFHKKRYSHSDTGHVLWYAGGTIDWDNAYAAHRGVDEVDHGQFDDMFETDFVSGCCMYIPASILEKVGLLDEAYFLYYEDTDYCMRANIAGFHILYEPSSVIWHKNAQSTGSSGSVIHRYYQTRNRLLFGMRYAPLRTRFALIRESFKMLFGSPPTRSAVLDFYAGKWGRK